MINHDGHVHSPFCPHGSDDPLEAYIDKAIRNGITTLSFTEHAPLPAGFEDPVPDKDSAMNEQNFLNYLQNCDMLKKKYADEITVYTGLEVDYIEGYEKETAAFLNKWGHKLDDIILSVHFVKLPDETYSCLDYSPEMFEMLITACGSLQNVYELYYKTLLLSIKADLGPCTPERIGHISLVRKFQTLYPRDFHDRIFLQEVLNEMAFRRKTLDVNTAGLSKPYCQEIYPSEYWIRRAKEAGIPLVYGSDAHIAGAVGAGRETVQHFFIP